MTDKELSALINVLRCANKITALQNDILDTFDALQKNPFDKESAQKQILSNNINHPDVFIAISAMPGVVHKTAGNMTQDDMIFSLSRQLDGLVAKEIKTCINSKE